MLTGLLVRLILSVWVVPVRLSLGGEEAIECLAGSPLTDVAYQELCGALGAPDVVTHLILNVCRDGFLQTVEASVGWLVAGAFLRDAYVWEVRGGWSVLQDLQNLSYFEVATNTLSTGLDTATKPSSVTGSGCRDLPFFVSDLTLSWGLVAGMGG